MNITRKENREMAGIAALGVLVMAAFIVLYIMRLGSVGTVSLLGSLTDVLLAAAAAAMALSLWHTAARGELGRLIWGSVGLGMALWAIAEIIWLGYTQTAVLHTAPFPSFADAVALAGYVPLTAALLMRFFGSQERPTKSEWTVLGVIAFAAFVAVFGLAAFPVLFAENYPVALKAVAALYPVLDLGLILAAALALQSTNGTATSPAWRFIASGLLVLAISDVLFGTLSWYGIYNAASPNVLTGIVDLLHHVGYAIVAFGVYVRLRLTH